MTINTVDNQPTAVSLQVTDYLLVWQAGQAPPTRKLPVSGLAAYYASLSGATFTGAVTISSGGFTVTGNSTITGTLTLSSTLTVSGGGVSVTGNSTVAGTLGVTGALSGALYNYLAGLTLSNDGVSPNSVLDIEAGVCSDSTNAVSIVLGAFTKSTSATWAAGTGNGGMGTGLTIADSTWYHVFAIINAGSPDVYFDTSITAANAPSSTTAFRRIGSFLTDGSAHILGFNQNGDEFIWTAFISESGITSPISTTSVLQSLAGVPPGVKVNALIRAEASGSAPTRVLLNSPAETAVSGTTLASNNNSNLIVQLNSQAVGGWFNIRTNASNQIQSVAGGSTTLIIKTNGWIDTRGRLA